MPTKRPPPLPGTKRHTTKRLALPARPAVAPTQRPASAPVSALIAPGSESGELAAVALRLRDEQIRAKVIYFGAEQETNEELDAITHAVVAELQALQAVGVKAVGERKPNDVERDLVRTLRALLDKLFSTRRKGFLKRKTEEIQRRTTTLFFNSELFRKIESSPTDTFEITWPDQAVYYALKKHEAGIIADLHLLKYKTRGLREQAVTRLEQFEKELRMEFLSRTTPELEKLLSVFRAVLPDFFRAFRKALPEFCEEVIKSSAVAEAGGAGYKIAPALFPQFREAFDLRFLQALVAGARGPIVQQLQSMEGIFRSDTLAFASDPHVFSEICEVMCDACYDYLHGEGFLDLPPGWRAHLDRE